MAAVLELPSDPERPTDSDATRPALAIAAPTAAPAPATSPASSGLKPIARLTSDSRVARIVPESDAVTVLLYSSQFALDFIRADYNFCASTIAASLGGKARALHTAPR